jgi:hypothetical protein
MQPPFGAGTCNGRVILTRVALYSKVSYHKPCEDSRLSGAAIFPYQKFVCPPYCYYRVQEINTNEGGMVSNGKTFILKFMKIDQFVKKLECSPRRYTQAHTLVQICSSFKKVAMLEEEFKGELETESSDQILLSIPM